MTSAYPIRTRALALVGRRLNPTALRLAHAGRGPFSVIRHVGRRSGRTFETPVILAPVPEGFIAELTWGDRVDWLRNIVAAGGCDVRVGGRWHRVVSIEPYATEAGLRAFGPPASIILRLLRKKEFRLLRTS
ncbi:nitroreductase family deazaflavin-dependent oxidoreductase [Enemella dayhoffiae]|uniref:Nitroreductase family deazaflavin-dependent oxidoreductase n=1 Tax=Enemella dayhoffiae TaxID=2016507 RepID=A0A255H2Z6_9ACTN|nr:nitroreductase family deazaflavin-dependent oxidoreductase [Enemella dayhoffiae]OYO22001.1 nitroreductase family deazaflavin-dependent oxidoreductase [Enemella dayhoffiae]